ncbi:MAG TPA: DUF4157 domain-containing protein [Bryobacteraceae bacterium]
MQHGIFQSKQKSEASSGGKGWERNPVRRQSGIGQLHASIGNQAVMGLMHRLSTPLLQRDPRPAEASKGTVYRAPANGIDVRYYLLPSETGDDKPIRTKLSELTAQMVTVNAMMSDPSFAVTQLLIWTGATTGFRIVLGKPTIYVDTKYILAGDKGAITHEMGHAVAHSFGHAPPKKEGAEEKPSGFRNVQLKVSDLFLALKRTKTQKLSKLVATIPKDISDGDIPLGLFMVSPLNWTKTGDLEHPWDNYDEFFASAFEGFVVNRKGLEASIKKHAAVDSSITPLGKELIAALEAIQTRKLPPKEFTINDKSKAEQEIKRAGEPPEIVKKTDKGKDTFISPERSTGLPGGTYPESPVISPLLDLVESLAQPESPQPAIKRSPQGGNAPSAAPPIVHQVLRSSGEPLDQSVRAFMEPKFGQDFSNVRVHNDKPAWESARAVQARAYTVGSHVVMGRGEYRPGAMPGKLLLAHELSHVLQQKEVRSVSSPLSISSPTDATEREAEANVRGIANSEPPRPAQSSQPMVARTPGDPEPPGFGGQMDDVVHDIREQREQQYTRLADEYRQSLFSQTGIKHGGPIGSPQEAEQILQRLHVDLDKLNAFVAQIRSSTAGMPQGPQSSDQLEQGASQAVDSLSPLGKTTWNRALAAVRSEPFFHNLLDSNEIHILPDSAACVRFNALTVTSEGGLRPGAERAKEEATLILLCRQMVEKGDLEQVRGVLAHELSHAAERLIAGSPTAELVTNPIIGELSAQLATLPQFQGMERHIRRYLHARIGGYPQAEIFADLQQLPQSPHLRKNDKVLETVICELRRLDAAGLPENIRQTLMEDLQRRTEIFYRLRIDEAQGAQARELAAVRDYAVATLKQALLAHDLERQGDSSIKVHCG